MAEHDCDKLSGAFGGVPLIKPTGSGMSLLSNLRDLSTNSEAQVPAEHQIAMKLLCRTPLCCQLLETNRFKDQGLRELMAFMRNPRSSIPTSMKVNWNRMQLCAADLRLRP